MRFAMIHSAPIRLAAVSLALLLAASCTAQADSPKTPAKAPPAKSSPTPEERAKSLLDKQMKALAGDNAALLATFAKGAVVMLPGSRRRSRRTSSSAGRSRA